MGDMADMIEQQMWDNDEFFEPRHVPAPAKDEWMTKQGQLLKLKDMDTSHLQNTIRMLERKNKPQFKNKIKELRKELASRPGFQHNQPSQIKQLKARDTKIIGARADLVIIDDFGPVEHLPEDSIDLSSELG